MPNQTLVIRADGDAVIGSGHIMRTLALAQAWRDAGGEVIFVSSCKEPKLLQRLYEEKVLVHQIDHVHPHRNDISDTLRIAVAFPECWVAVDGEHFDFSYQEGIRAAGHRLLVIDDRGNGPQYSADILLNQNAGAESKSYNPALIGHLRLGARHALLRREFLKSPTTRSFSMLTGKVLITTGASDPFAVAEKILMGLEQVPVANLETTILVGALSPHFQRLSELAGKAKHPTKVLNQVSNMPLLLREMDLAVAAGGSTSLELAYLGVPSLLYCMADNQKAACEAWGRSGAFSYLGEVSQYDWSKLAGLVTTLLNDPTERKTRSQLAKAMVPGDGAESLVTSMKQIRAGVTGRSRVA